jgi:hypothetical protein
MAHTYTITLTGTTPLLMHNNSIEWRDHMTAWLANPENKKHSIAGDDRTPAYRWMGLCYHDGDVLGIPSDNVMTALREGGAKVPKGTKNTTWKRESQSGLVVNELLWPLTPRVAWADLASLRDEREFAAHEARVRALGFSLWLKNATISRSKHIRVRPRFDHWAATGTITVLDDAITRKVLVDILEMAGAFCGLGDWRPSSPSKPGPFGKFAVTVR